MEMMMDFLSMTFLPFFCDGSYSILRSSNTRPAGCHPQRRLMTFFTSVQCPLLAHSGHRDALSQCPLLGVKRR